MGRTEYNVSTAAFVADPHSINRLPTGRQIDWDAIGDSYRDTAEIVKLSAAAAADDTTLAVDALPVAIPAGTNLYFGQAKEFARVTANAAAGATSLTVEALPSALEDNDEATIGGAGDKTIPAGTVMAALSSGKMVPRAARPGSETAIGILESAAVEGSKSAALSGYLREPPAGSHWYSSGHRLHIQERTANGRCRDRVCLVPVWRRYRKLTWPPLAGQSC
jgi:hypothetical protein